MSSAVSAPPRPSASSRFRRTQIVVPALPDHHAAVLDVRIGVEPVELGVDLALQIAGERADPDRTAVPFRPQARRCDVADRLAHAGTGLGDRDGRSILAIARDECRRQRGGEIRLTRTVFGSGTEQVREAAPRFAGFDGNAAGLRLGGVVRELRQTAPYAKTRGIGRERVRRAEPAQDRLRPGPAGSRHERGNGRRIRVGGSVELVEQQSGRAGESGGILGQPFRPGQVERVGEPARGRETGRRRAYEREQFEQIAGPERSCAQPLRQNLAMADDGNRPLGEGGNGVAVRNRPRLAVSIEEQGFPDIGDQNGMALPVAKEIGGCHIRTILHDRRLTPDRRKPKQSPR